MEVGWQKCVYAGVGDTAIASVNENGAEPLTDVCDGAYSDAFMIEHAESNWCDADDDVYDMGGGVCSVYGDKGPRLVAKTDDDVRGYDTEGAEIFGCDLESDGVANCVGGPVNDVGGARIEVCDTGGGGDRSDGGGRCC